MSKQVRHEKSRPYNLGGLVAAYLNIRYGIFMPSKEYCQGIALIFDEGYSVTKMYSTQRVKFLPTLGRKIYHVQR